MRLVFLTTYGGCVVASFVAPAVVDAQGVGTVKAASAAAASAAILLVTQGLVAWRLRHPLRAHDRPQDGTGLALDMGAERSPADVAAQDDPHADSPISPEDIALAHALEQYMRLHRPYLHADLKLSHLAQALDVGEYRISRAVHGPLGNRNVSHYINGFRLDLARTLLADRSHDHWSVLVIALESGFGSLGAFHRAFKASEGCTPGEYRAEQQSSGAVPSAI